jgi:hypothetical protein
VGYYFSNYRMEKWPFFAKIVGLFFIDNGPFIQMLKFRAVRVEQTKYSENKRPYWPEFQHSQ